MMPAKGKGLKLAAPLRQHHGNVRARSGVLQMQAVSIECIGTLSILETYLRKLLVSGLCPGSRSGQLRCSLLFFSLMRLANLALDWVQLNCPFALPQ